MRQRRVKDADERLKACENHIIENPENFKGQWEEAFPVKGNIFLEIGCGKGKFITDMALDHQDNNYLAVEGQKSIAVRAAEKMKESETGNVMLINDYVEDLTSWFCEGEINGLYLNFSDPWPKNQHAKRRLTHSSYLKEYRAVIKKGGFVAIKTDNDGLFGFTLKELEKEGFTVIEATDNLHDSSYDAKEILTEYESKFIDSGKNINYVKAIV